jgi:hypothetical protein
VASGGERAPARVAVCGHRARRGAGVAAPRVLHGGEGWVGSWRSAPGQGDGTVMRIIASSFFALLSTGNGISDCENAQGSKHRLPLSASFTTPATRQRKDSAMPVRAVTAHRGSRFSGSSRTAIGEVSDLGVRRNDRGPSRLKTPASGRRKPTRPAFPSSGSSIEPGGVQVGPKAMSGFAQTWLEQIADAIA